MAGVRPPFVPRSAPMEDAARPGFFRTWGVWLSLAAAACVLLADPPAGMTGPAHRTLAVAVLTAGLWFTGAVPLGAASLAPLVAFPLLGVLSAESAADAYVNKLVFLYLGGFLLALGLERWAVHERLALHTLRLTGTSPRRVVAGFMLAAAGLSMWISNTAATIMLLPVAAAMLDALRGGGGKNDGGGNNKLTVALLLGLAYGASLGGIATPIGTPTNAQFLAVWQDLFGDAGRFDFASWMLAFGPVSLTLLFLTWGLLTWNLGAAPGLAAAGRGYFADRLRARGPLSVPERRMLCVFGLAAALWVVPKPLFAVVGDADGGAELIERLSAAGWLDVLKPDDSTTAVFCAALAFALPAGDGRGSRLLNWKTAERLPWDILLLFGAGLALARAFDETGLSEWVGRELGHRLDGWPAWAVVGAVCLTMTFLTECTSNVATCGIVLPVLAAVALELKLPPELLMLPAAASASCAFMLPVATPPNAIVFGSGRVTMGAMARTGFLLNLLGAAAVTGLTLAWVGRVL